MSRGALPAGTAAAVARLIWPEPDPYAADPVGWARDVLGVHLWSRQVEVLESVRDHPRTAVRSGHGLGKSVCAAIAALHWLDVYEDSRVLSTATTWAQLESVLWAAIGQLHAQGRRLPGASERAIFAARPTKTRLELPDGRAAIGLSAKPENSESFSGHHAAHLLFIADEASGIPAAIFEAAEGFLTADGARALLIGNPTRSSGEFYAAFHSKRAEYSTIAISAYDSPNVKGERVPPGLAARLPGKAWIESRERAWGADSPLFQVRVKGEFPTQGTDNVIALGAVEDAQARELPADPAQDRVVVACDVARYGDDETVIAVRVGNRVRIDQHYVGKPLTETAGRLVDVARRYPGPHVEIVVDDVGLGGGVTDILRDQGWQVVAFNGGERAWQRGEYPNRRSELWFQMAASLPELDLDPDEQLAADLTSPLYRFDQQGRRVVEPKDDTRKRLGRSPDRADACLLCLAASWQPMTAGGRRERSSSSCARCGVLLGSRRRWWFDVLDGGADGDEISVCVDCLRMSSDVMVGRHEPPAPGLMDDLDGAFGAGRAPDGSLTGDLLARRF